jgi:hypothetical protein
MIYNKRRFDVSEDEFWLHMHNLGRLVLYLAASAATVIMMRGAVEYLYLPTVHAWMPCDAETLAPSESLQRALVPDPGVAYACTTTHTARSLPCMCCVRGHCWRGATIEKNSTAMGTMWDRVAGRTLKRRVPRYMRVTYTSLSSAGTYEKQERDEAVGDVLRALELLHNYPVAGIEEEEEL